LNAHAYLLLDNNATIFKASEYYDVFAF
jgi:hypothetical protein